MPWHKRTPTGDGGGSQSWAGGPDVDHATGDPPQPTLDDALAPPQAANTCPRANGARRPDRVMHRCEASGDGSVTPFLEGAVRKPHTAHGRMTHDRAANAV